jgi:hypothetical protein
MHFYDLVSHLEDQIEFSCNAFGPDYSYKRIVDHLFKEIKEIQTDPNNLEEWIDVVLLALDGAWRSGHSPEQVVQGLSDKLDIIKNRIYPDWRTADPDKAIEHIRD